MQNTHMYTLEEYFSSEEYKSMVGKQDGILRRRGLNKRERDHVHMRVRHDLQSKLRQYKYVHIEGYGTIREV